MKIIMYFANVGHCVISHWKNLNSKLNLYIKNEINKFHQG
jgi:hypothetical protein